MIIVFLKGGLGNQLFQYACGRALLAHQQKKGDIRATLKLDLSNYAGGEGMDTSRSYGLGHFNIIENIATDHEISKLKYPRGILSIYYKKVRTKLKLFNVRFISRILKKNGDVYLDGFWQSEKYFKDIRRILLEEISLKKPFSLKAQEYAAAISKEPHSVSLHVRRTDYVADEKAISIFGSHCNQEYYTGALSIITQKISSSNLHVFVFSDDIQWVRENLDIPYQKTYVSETSAPDYERMMLMSLCRYHIIANSTFGWWGAWLDQKPSKIVVAPSVWIPGLNLPISDIIPPEWIKI